MGMSLTSQAFKNGECIPSKYTCDGECVSPPLSWSGAPEETKTFALIMDDPDAPIGVFTHWVIFNIPMSENALLENIPKKGFLPNGAIQGRNGFERNGYGGPCPPSGTHRYQFHLYALNTQLNLLPDATREDTLRAMDRDIFARHILAKAEFTGLYGRR